MVLLRVFSFLGKFVFQVLVEFFGVAFGFALEVGLDCILSSFDLSRNETAEPDPVQLDEILVPLG